jgi:hypothetical protein
MGALSKFISPTADFNWSFSDYNFKLKRIYDQRLKAGCFPKNSSLVVSLSSGCSSRAPMSLITCFLYVYLLISNPGTGPSLSNLAF